MTRNRKRFPASAYVGRIGDSAVAVVADSVWSAMEGRRVLNVTWDEGPNKDLNSAAILASLKQAAGKKGANLYAAGDPAKASGRHISAEYALPFMAHAPMEPGNCTAHYQGSKCELWAPTAGSAGLPRFRGHGHRTRFRSSEGKCHVDGRRVRPPPRTRLCGGGSAGFQGDQWSREGDLDA